MARLPVDPESERLGEPQESDALARQMRALAMHPTGVLKRRWPWVLGGLLAGLAAVAVFLIFVKPVYQAQSAVLISSQQIPEEFVRSTVAGIDSLTNVNAMMGEVLSMQKLGAMIEKYDLYPNQRKQLPLGEIVELMRTSIAIEQQRNVHVDSPRETSSIYVISFQYESPVKAAEVANDLAAKFIDASTEKRSQQARLTTEFLRRELTRAETELREINRQITEFRRDHRGEMPEDQESVLRKLERLEMQRQSLSTSITAAEERLTQLRNAKGGPSSPEATLMELRLQLASELAIHTDEHPNVITLRRRIERMEGDVDEVSSLLGQEREQHMQDVEAAQRELKNLRERLGETEKEVAKLDANISQIPTHQETLEALNERATVLSENHVGFMRKVQEAELAETLEAAQQGPRVSLLDRANVPTEPVHSRPLLLFFGLAATLSLTVALALVVELVDPVVLSSEHFDFVGGPPLLGSIHDFS